jgi:hypothetical protein
MNGTDHCPATHLIKRENDGVIQVMQGFDYGRALIDFSVWRSPGIRLTKLGCKR